MNTRKTKVKEVKNQKERDNGVADSANELTAEHMASFKIKFLSLLKNFGALVISIISCMCVIVFLIYILYCFVPRKAFVNIEMDIGDLKEINYLAEEVEYKPNGQDLNQHIVSNEPFQMIIYNTGTSGSVEKTYILFCPSENRSFGEEGIYFSGASISKIFLYSPVPVLETQNPDSLNPYKRWIDFEEQIKYLSVDLADDSYKQINYYIANEAFYYLQDSVKVFPVGNTKAFIYDEALGEYKKLVFSEDAPISLSSKGLVQTNPITGEENQVLGFFQITTKEDMVFQEKDWVETYSGNEKMTGYTIYTNNTVSSASVKSMTINGTGQLEFSLLSEVEKYTIKNQEVFLSASDNTFINFSTEESGKIQIWGYVDDAVISNYSIFPSFFKWFFSNVLMAPLALLTVVFSGIQLYLSLVKKK